MSWWLTRISLYHYSICIRNKANVLCVCCPPFPPSWYLPLLNSLIPLGTPFHLICCRHSGILGRSYNAIYLFPENQALFEAPGRSSWPLHLINCWIGILLWAASLPRVRKRESILWWVLSSLWLWLIFTTFFMIKCPVKVNQEIDTKQKLPAQVWWMQHNGAEDEHPW